MKRVLITGAGGGLGRALVGEFSLAGYKVLATAREVQKDIESFQTDGDTEPHLITLDVTDDASIKALGKVIDDQYGGIDLLINNAAIAVPALMEEVGAQVIDKIMATNFSGAIKLIQMVLPGMRAQRSGRIINISSLSAHLGLPGDGIYSASKAALERSCESLKSELLPFNIQVSNAIPGKVNTPLTRKMHAALAESENSSYTRLSQRLKNELQESDSGGSNARKIAMEIVRLAEQEEPAFYVPVGDQAREVMKRLASLSETKRNELIQEYSVAGWWASQRL